MKSGTLPYIKFLWDSHNAHGVHSPFVYNFITRNFYEKGPQLSCREYRRLQPGINYKEAALLYRVMVRLRPAKLLVLGENADRITEFIRHTGEMHKIQLWFFSLLAPIPGGVDVAYISGNEKEALLASLHDMHKNINRDTVCIIAGIHSTPQMEEAWQAVKAYWEVTVTIDAYHLGFVFLRQGQAKQHFLIRTGTSKVADALLGARNLWGLLA